MKCNVTQSNKLLQGRIKHSQLAEHSDSGNTMESAHIQIYSFRLHYIKLLLCLSFISSLGQWQKQSTPCMQLNFITASPVQKRAGSQRMKLFLFSASPVQNTTCRNLAQRQNVQEDKIKHSIGKNRHTGGTCTSLHMEINHSHHPGRFFTENRTPNRTEPNSR